MGDTVSYTPSNICSNCKRHEAPYYKIYYVGENTYSKKFYFCDYDGCFMRVDIKESEIVKDNDGVKTSWKKYDYSAIDKMQLDNDFKKD